MHRWTHVSGCGMQGCGTDHLCRSQSVLPATDWLLGSPPSPQGSPSFPADLPAVRRLPDAGTSPQFPAREAGPILLPFLFFFPSFFHPTQLRGDLSCPFRCPISSASVHQVRRVNCSICRWILDVFVGRDEVHVLLLLHHLGKLPVKGCYACVFL